MGGGQHLFTPVYLSRGGDWIIKSIHKYLHQGAETSYMSVCTKRVCVSNNEPKTCTVGFLQYIRISLFVQSRRVHLFIVNCLLKNKFNIHLVYYLYI